MSHIHFPHNNPFGENNRRAGEYDAFPGAPPTMLNTQPTYGRDSIRPQASSHPTTDYPSEHVSRVVGNAPGVHYQAFEDRGRMNYSEYTLLRLPSPMTHGHSHRPMIGAGDRENLLSSSRGARNTVLGTPKNKAGPNEGVSWTGDPIPLEATRHSTGDSCYNFSPTNACGQYDQTTETQRHGREPAIPVDQKPGRSDYHGSVDNSSNFCRISTGYKPGDTEPTQGYGVPFLPEDYVSTSANGSHPNAMVPWGGEPIPYILRYGNIGSVQNSYTVTDHAPLPRGRSGEQENLSKSPCRPIRAQRPMSGRKTMEVVNSVKSEASRRHARRSNPGGHQDSTTPLPMVSALHRGLEVLKMVVQTPYTSVTRQRNWTRQPPIEFGWLRLTDAENPEYMGMPGHGDRVFDYEGVGGSILCRLNFSGQEIGRLRISTANHRAIRQSITKKKLVLEVAKLVKLHIETIKAQPDHDGVTFENAVLTKLCHVSRASWQPELWYETASGRNPS